jgi:hypothetical protein
MVRNVVGFAVFAGLSVLALKFIFKLLGFAFGLAMTLLWWALLGWIIYMIIKLVSPDTARRIREMFTGESTA